MRHYFSKTRGFLNTDVHETIPRDAVEITQSEYDALFVGQENGKVILWDDYGRPYLEDPVDNRTYAEKRRMEYPPIEDYLDGVVKNDQAQIDAYIAACLAVKEKYPKE